MAGESLLVWGMLFGAIGLGFFSYGKRQKAVVPLFTGIALMMFPYFAPNLTVLLIGSAILLALPWFVRV